MKTIKPIILLLFALSSMSASAQRFGQTEQDSIACVRNISLYSEFFRQQDFASAFEPWYQVFRICPANHLNTFIRGRQIVMQRIAQERDAEKREKYIDLLLEVWDKRIRYFPQGQGRCKGFLLSRKANDLRTLRPQQVNEAFEMVYRAVVELGVGNDHVAPLLLFQYAVESQRSGNIDIERVVDVYEISASYLERILREQPGDTNIINALASLDAAFEPLATCDVMIPIFERRWEENKSDIAFLQNVTRVLDNANCTDAELFFTATRALHALDPSPRSAFLIARMLAAQQDWARVISYLATHADGLETDRQRVQAFLLLTQAFSQERRYREGRATALRALEIDPTEGMAHMLIGMMYAQTARDCGGDDAISRGAVYWVVVDRLERARSLNPNLPRISEHIAAFRQHFPSGDDLFFQGITEGSTWRVECWIQETTIVRSRP
ncbi:MAG: hypothetical protein FWC94_05665 [Bacteroidales bacterium]|nr:hypothetical protein [Bacteroidales bacterium]